MSEHNQRPDVPDILEQAIEAVVAKPTPAGPPADVLASTAEVIRNRLNVMAAREENRKRTPRYIRYGSFATAAAIIVAVFVGLFGWSNGTARAFDKALEKLRTAAAVRYQVKTESPSTSHVDEVTIRGKQMRVELVAFSKLTWIIDSETSGMLILNPPTKTYQTVDLAAKSGGIGPFDIRGANVREQLEDLIKQKPIFEKTETVDGISTDRYAITGGEALGLTGDWTVWLDRKSSYPVRVLSQFTLSGKKLTREYSNFDWSPKVGDGDFSLDPPGDYREDTIFHTNPPLAPFPKKK